jgi:sugar lactone lactonase YvrE
VNVRRGDVFDPESLALLLDPDGATPCNPNSVAVNGGKLYVVCLNPDAIRVYDAGPIRSAAVGAEVTTAAEKTITSADFSELIGIAFDGQNNLWVASFGNSRLVQISAQSLASDDPQVTATFPNSPGSPVSLAFDADGSLWVLGHFDDGILLNFPADQLVPGNDPVPQHCITTGNACGPNPGLFKFPEGVALLNGQIWVSNNGGNTPGRELVAFRVDGGNLVVDQTFSPAVCPGGLFATSQHLWVNDPTTDCGASVADQASGVGAVLRFTLQELADEVTNLDQLILFTDITSRPGFGGLFVEE